ncbi:PGF-pre-PGF domain-containing protein [Methanofollis sp. W23]|uniref:PKD domain-containing protein n=1 Tax=Methanofollis sp. W23 TaxID=2817849 RepID=UPI001AE839BF|nr:PKD domain-containing protein [Methanofollis sp. W23]MBP2146761.1 PGF-pre-PGF domain-containing protein [Methanofollis sp. W23]
MSKIIHWRWLPIVAGLMMALCCCAGVAAGAPTDPVEITGPTEITEPGHYILKNSFYGAYNGTFITIGSNDVLLDGHGYTIMTNGTGSDRTGILVENRGNVTIANVYLNSFDEGCVVRGGTGVELLGANPLNCERVGIKLENTAGCTVHKCTISENKGPGLEIIEGAENTIFNNRFKNTENVRLSGQNIYVWNQTKTEGENILLGPYLGGNFWATPDGDGWSETHPDSDSDGICEEPFYLTENNVDFLPLHQSQPGAPDLRADFTANVTSGEAPLAVQFTDNSAGAPTTWAWDFGDGANSTEQHPSHVYAAPGPYNVTLTVSDGELTKTEARTWYIDVKESTSPAPLEANFSVDITAGETPLKVQFTDTSAGDPTTWAWDFGDGANSTEQHPIHYYQTPGTYNVTLTISDGTNDDTYVMPDSLEITPSSRPLMANFTAYETTGAMPFVVKFIDLSTGNPTAWSWDFGDNGTSDIQNPVHTYEEAGTYNVTLIASNGTANRTLTMKDYVTVEESAPKPIAANFTADTTSGKTPLTVHFNDTSTGNVTTWEWSFGDGTGSSSLQHPTYVYKKSGTYTVSLTVSDGETDDTLTRESYITVTTQSTRRSSSGGGGGGTSSNVGVRSGLNSGDSVVFTFKGLGVSEVKVTAADRIDGIRLSLKKASDEPEGLETAVYQYLLADMTYAMEDDIEEIVFSFDVLKSWLKDHDAGAGDIVLWWYDDETWQPLRTEVVKETNTRVYYQAVSPGFSYFAIAVGEGMTIIPEGALSESGLDAEETTVPEEPETTDSVLSEPTGNVTTTETTAQPASPGVVGVVLALLAVGLVVLFVRRR